MPPNTNFVYPLTYYVNYSVFTQPNPCGKKSPWGNIFAAPEISPQLTSQLWKLSRAAFFLLLHKNYPQQLDKLWILFSIFPGATEAAFLEPSILCVILSVFTGISQFLYSSPTLLHKNYPQLWKQLWIIPGICKLLLFLFTCSADKRQWRQRPSCRHPWPG